MATASVTAHLKWFILVSKWANFLRRIIIDTVVEFEDHLLESVHCLLCLEGRVWVLHVIQE
jgi:hypothetical protein